jgi:hypothetical protein
MIQLADAMTMQSWFLRLFCRGIANYCNLRVPRKEPKFRLPPSGFHEVQHGCYRLMSAMTGTRCARSRTATMHITHLRDSASLVQLTLLKKPPCTRKMRCLIDAVLPQRRNEIATNWVKRP